MTLCVGGMEGDVGYVWCNEFGDYGQVGNVGDEAGDWFDRS